jgi:hypothetical protein
MPAGQAQKEFYVNEAHALLDGLLHPAIQGEANETPATPGDGDTWLVGEQPVGDWQGHAGELALRQSDNRLFASPNPGMRIFDQSTGQDRRFDGSWTSADPVAEPDGGTSVDTEARAAIAQLIAALVSAGILPKV